MAASRRLHRRIPDTKCEVPSARTKAAVVVEIEVEGEISVAYFCRTHAKEAP